MTKDNDGEKECLKCKAVKVIVGTAELIGWASMEKY